MNLLRTEQLPVRELLRYIHSDAERQKQNIEKEANKTHTNHNWIMPPQDTGVTFDDKFLNWERPSRRAQKKLETKADRA